MARILSQFFEVFPSDATCLVPLGVCVDGAIFGQGLSAHDPLSGTVERGLEAQAQAAFAKMQELVERAGASLDNVGRVCCYVRNPEDREPVYELWDSMFPRADDRPAFKILTGELRGDQRVALDVIAIHGARRKRIDIAGVEARDPAVAIGDWLFTSRLHGLSPETGQQVEGLAAQVAQGVANARRLIDLSGGGHELVQVTTFGRDADYQAIARVAVEEALKQERLQPEVNTLQSWVRPNAEGMVEAIALRPATGAPTFRELFLSPHLSNQATGFQFGQLVFYGGISPASFPGGAIEGSFETQLRVALDNMERLLKEAGCSRSEVARVTFFLRDLNDRPALNSVWQEWFPNPQDRPPHTYLPAALRDGQEVSLQVIAIADGKRRVLAVPGVEHGDPMSLAAVTGNLLVSSRIFGRANGTGLQALEEHTADCFASADALFAQSGSAWTSLQQLTVYLSSPEFRAAVQQNLEARLGKGAAGIKLEFLETDLGRRELLPRLQLTALTQRLAEP
jgi:2-iminobutanoate/2-iminopropanoate deaminase